MGEGREAARQWEQSMAGTLPPRISQKGRMTKKNRSGVPGVRLAREVQRKPSGNEYVYWTWKAHWPKCPYSGGVSWRTHVHGDEESFVLAVLTLRLETTDRKRVLNELLHIKGSADYNTILALKKQTAP